MQITIKPSDHVFPCDADETVLQAAMRADLMIPYGCRNGACGTCKGKILAGFLGDEPQIIPEKKMREYRIAKHLPEPASRQTQREQRRRDAVALWVAACKGGAHTYGDFLLVASQ